jgi:hypothetical protein
MNEHPVSQPIEVVENATGEAEAFYRVGRNGVTRIEACTSCLTAALVIVLTVSSQRHEARQFELEQRT